MIDGLVFAGDRMLGSGFCLADLFVVTAAHVVDGHAAREVSFVISASRVEVESIDIRTRIDVALLRLRHSMAAVPRLTRSENGAPWTVTSQPRGNDPVLGGVVTARRRITNIHSCEVHMLQLFVDEDLGSYQGYSGSAVYIGDSVTGILLEQVHERGRGAKPRGTNVLYAVPIETVVREFNLKRVIEPYQADRRPAGLLLDAAFFDLDPLKREMDAVLSGSSAPAVAFGVEYAEPVFSRKLCEWLGHYLGEAQCRDWVVLDPTITSVDRAVRTVMRYLPDLERIHVVCPVRAGGVPRMFIEGFWGQLSAVRTDTDHRLVVLLVGSPEGGYPEGIARLPEPAFAAADIAAWVGRIAATSDWSPSMVDSLRDLILESSRDGEGRDGEGLSIRYTIEALEKYIQLILFHSDELRTTLERRSRHADAAPR